MFDIRHCIPWTGSLLMACVALVGCAPKTNVSATGDVPAQYSHMFVTTQELWFNTVATATPDDTTWLKFTLTAPTTVDLVTATQGTLSQITTGLGVPAGTYAQIRLIPVDASTALATSASAAGALFNMEVDYVDTAGASVQAPLELQNPDKGIGIATTLQVTSNINGTLSTTPTTTTTNTSGTPSTFTPSGTSIDGGTTPVTTPTTDTTDTSTSTTSVTPISLAISFNGSRDLVPFIFSTVNPVNAFLLNPHMTAYNASAVGAIQGSLTLTGLTGTASTNTSSTDTNIQVTAETLSADGTRHEVVNSTPVTSAGTFVLYPLTSSSSTPATYDLVIHGPTIATIIIKGVTVNVGDPATTTPVSIGTITPRTVPSFTVNLSTTATALPPAGALVGFYQTLPAAGEVPYLIEERPMDPFNLNFASDQAISGGTIDTASFISGSAIVPSTVTPTEGAAVYRVSATAPLYADGPLTTTVTGSAAGSTTAVLVAAPALTVESGAVATSASFTMSLATLGKYNQGELIISHDGAIVATASLNTMLAQGSGTLTVSGLPGGTTSSVFDAGVYYVSVRVWNTSSPTTTLSREIYPAALNLSSGSITGFAVNID